MVRSIMINELSSACTGRKLLENHCVCAQLSICLWSWVYQIVAVMRGDSTSLSMIEFVAKRRQVVESFTDKPTGNLHRRFD